MENLEMGIEPKPKAKRQPKAKAPTLEERVDLLERQLKTVVERIGFNVNLLPKE